MIRSAFLIASDYYQDPGLVPLFSSVPGAHSLDEVLKNPDIGGFDTQMFVNEVKARVEHEIFRFCADRGRDDVLLFYLAGHGLMDQDGRLYFATSDTMTENLAATAVSAD